METNISLDQIISIIGQIATWVTLIVVYKTLKEMENQRISSYQPDLQIAKVNLYGFIDLEDEIPTISRWDNDPEKKDNQIVIPSYFIYNIGAGAAKSIKIEYHLDYLKIVNSIKDYCDKYSIPIEIVYENDILSFTLNGKCWFYFVTDQITIEPFLMPSSNDNEGIKIDFPYNYLDLLSIFIYLRFRDQPDREETSTSNNIEDIEPEIVFPYLNISLSYKDIGNNKYAKNFRTFINTSYYFFPQFKKLKKRISDRFIFKGIATFEDIIVD